MMNDIDKSGIIPEGMTIEEKVAQLFVTTPESLLRIDNPVTEFSNELEQVLSKIPIGGIIYFAKNLLNPDQTCNLLSRTQMTVSSRCGIPLFQCIDEEGGYIANIAGNPDFNVDNVGTPYELAQTENAETIFLKGKYVGEYLSRLGFNVDFAPCVDVLTNPDNTVIGKRSYGIDPVVVDKFASSFARGLIAGKVIPSYKHFPGHGHTDADSHMGYAYSNKTLDELFECELIPYITAAENGIPMIMAAHISLPKVTDFDEPASLSRQLIIDLLRTRLGFDGIIISDSLRMKAISDSYTPDEASIKVIEAGADLMLMPADFYEAYNGVINAVKCGRLSIERVDESVKRILRIKRLHFNRGEIDY